MAALRDTVQGALAAPRARVADWLEQLQPRERWMVGAAAVAAGLLIVWLAIVAPIQDALERLDRGLAAARRDAAAIGQLAGRYRSLRAQVSALEQAAGSTGDEASVFAQLESIAVPIAGREHITAMNPSSRPVADDLTEEAVEVRVEGIPMRSLVSLLHALEHRERPLPLVRVSVKRQYKNPELVDATLVVARLHPK
ncbi:MAG TPA: type II secretion system protein GspM [Candidatus Binatia bacterium]|nr:type II secretion system protein GspM [Candidatus Binatia bacterium]